MTERLQRMSQVVVCSVLPNQSASIRVVTDAGESFKKWRHLSETPFLPVGGFECDPKHFTAATSWTLPQVKPLDLAAFIFQRAPVPDSISRALILHLDLLGDRAGPLFQDWARAVARVQAAA